jgi:hypothetical protein
MTKTAKIIVAATIVLLAFGATTLFLLRHKIAGHMTLARAKRMIANHVAEPFDLTGYYTTPASYFAQITQFPAWKTVPTGFQVFAGVPLQIDGLFCLWGGGTAKLGLVFPEEITGIQMDRKFQSLYVYHCAFFESTNETPVYDVVFRYEDGSSATNQILYGSDVFDWIVRSRNVIEPSGSHSRLAWHSERSPSLKTLPLRFCLTAIENPYPSLEVTTIDLYSCKSRTAACILAFTTGKAGLMK